MLIDTHAHLGDEKYHGIIEKIIQGAIENKVEIIINPGTDLKSSIECVELSSKYPFIYAAVGIHPHEVRTTENDSYEKITELAKNSKVVAIGEVGLDYYYEYTPRDEQIIAFEKQIEIGKEMDLPLIIHSRDAHKDTFDILEKYKGDIEGVVHSYSGSWDMAKKYLDLGLYLSFSGTITFKNARKLPEVVSRMPIERLLIETDSPYLTPVPHRGKINDPSYVEYVARKISDIRECTYEDFCEEIIKNTYKLFSKLK